MTDKAEAPTLDPKKVYEKLSAPFPEEAIQRTDGAKTGKGYNTTGVGYQFIVNRFNEVLGPSGWSWSFDVVRDGEGEGVMKHDITVETRIAVGFDPDRPNHSHTCVGGHRSKSHADALKGAITNSFKKTAAFYGVGKAAFEGTIDDDNVPKAGNDKEMKPPTVERKSVPLIEEDFFEEQDVVESEPQKPSPQETSPEPADYQPELPTCVGLYANLVGHFSASISANMVRLRQDLGVGLGKVILLLEPSISITSAFAGLLKNTTYSLSSVSDTLSPCFHFRSLGLGGSTLSASSRRFVMRAQSSVPHF